MLKKGIDILLAGILVLSLSACGGNNGNNNENVTPTMPASPAASPPAATTPAAGTVNAAEAENLYRQNCIACHAADLSGGMGPNLQKIGGEMTVAEIHDKIVKGGGGMPGFENKLTEEQITAITGWLASKT